MSNINLDDISSFTAAYGVNIYTEKGVHPSYEAFTRRSEPYLITLLNLKQEEEGWGAKVIDRMAKDLKETFPEMSGFSPRNIKYMHKFAQCWPDYEIVQQVAAQIPWRTNLKLIDKLQDEESRIWYAMILSFFIFFVLKIL